MAHLILKEWINRVFDPDFFVSDRYIELLIDEIPNKKRVEVLISLYKRGLPEAGLNLQSVFRALLTRIGEENLTDFISLVSEEFKIATDEYMLEQSLTLFPSELWPRLSEASRLRIENKLLRSVENGQTGLRDDSFENEEYLVGRLGIMSVKIVKHISLKKELRTKIQRKIFKGGSDLEYVVAYFLEHIPLILYNFPSDSIIGRTVPYNSVVQLITKNYTRYSPSTKARMQNSVNQLPEDWRDLIIKEIPELDDIPF